MSEVVDWHGWSTGAMTLHVGPLPGRKSIALYLADKANATSWPLAYFSDEDKAWECLVFLDAFADWVWSVGVQAGADSVQARTALPF